MDDELKKLLEDLPAETKKQAFDLLKGAGSPNSSGAPTTQKSTLQEKENALRERLIDRTLSGLNNKKSSALEDRERAEAIIARRVEAAPRRVVTSSSQPNDPYEGKIRREVYKELGIADALNENRSEFDLNRLDAKAAAIGKTRDEYESMPRLERMKLESAGAAAEAERRQGIRDSVALPFNSQFLKDKEKFEAPFKQQGLPAPGADRTGYEEGNRSIFKDAQGRIEDPSTLKARLIKEGMNPNDATLAAGQRYRDMFGRQADVVMGVAPERRMEVMQQLKDARKDNLQALTAARLNNPFRREVGVTTKIEAPDGTVLAQRGEGEVGVARGGTAGAAGSTVDAPGRMELTDAGRKAVENRTYTSTVDASGATAKPGSEGGLTAVAGKYGTAVGGKMNFPEALTDKQRLGQEPLSEANQKYKDSFLASARGSALNDGKVNSTAANLMQIDPTAAAKTPIAAKPVEDKIKEQLAKPNSQDALDKAADEELKKRQTAKRRA